MLQDQAKSNLRKYRIVKIVTVVIWGTIVLCLTLFSSVISGVIAFIIGIIVARFIGRYFSKKYITGTLYKDFNAPLFYEILKQGKIFTREANWQITAEYAVGNYENVILTCEKKLQEPKLAKKHKYFYLVNLAMCYFDRGDDEALTEVCSRFRREIEKESPRRKKKLKHYILSIELYESYLSGDFDACIEKMSQPADQPLRAINRETIKARILMLRGDKESARALFESVIDRAPGTNYAILSKHGIEAIDKGIEYKETFAPLDLSHEPIIFTPPKSDTILTVVLRVSFVLSVLLFVFTVGQNIELPSDYDKAMAEIKEKISSAVKEEYDNVTVLHVYYLTANGEEDGEVVSSCFVANTDDGVILGTLYYYVGDDTPHFRVECNLSTAKRPHSFEFDCIERSYRAECMIVTNEKDIPESYLFKNEINDNGETYYIIIKRVFLKDQQI